MSAIWGIVNLDGNLIDKSKAERLKKVYLSKKIDKVDEYICDSFYIACGIQFVNEESKYERFPYILDNKYMVADVIIDNREELLDGEKSSEPDGQLMFEILNKDYESALNKMLGAYSFAYFDNDMHTLRLVSDVVGNRSVYYHVSGSTVYFSTIIPPLIEIIEAHNINEAWFQRFADTHDLRVDLEASETPIEEIYRVEPGEEVTISVCDLKKRAYWNPYKDRRTLRYKDFGQYKELVLETYRKCVESVIRDGKETGILLSGGLDSNSVAAYAAPYLKSKAKKLYSFTSVPVGHSDEIDDSQYGVENEAFYIKEVAKRHSNLEPDYIYTGNADVLEINRQIIDKIGLPYKTITNIPWIYEAYKRAAEKNCGVLLSGQYGNITISFGDFEVLFTTLFQKGHLISLYKELSSFSKRFKYSRKEIIKDLLHFNNEATLEYMRSHMYDKVALRQIGEMEVALSLETGIVHRDPTRDRRLIELVLALPIQAFVRDGKERLLVREYMKDLIPESIAQDDSHRGRQGVGGKEYIEKNWNIVSRELRRIYSNSEGDRIWNQKELNERIDNVDVYKDTFGIIELIYTALACEYMERLDER